MPLAPLFAAAAWAAGIAAEDVEDEDSGESDYESEEDFLSKYGFKADPYTGSIET